LGIIVSGKELSQELKDAMREEVINLQNEYKRVPHLAVILVGNNPSSISYVTGKEKASIYVGIKNTTIRLDEATTEESLINLIEELNVDPSVDGILVQLPLPKHINEERIIESISIKKDVDGFHPLNVANLWLKKDCMLPCTPKGIIKLLEKANIKISGKNVCVLGRSNIVGLPISKLLIDRNATVTIAHSKTLDLANITSKADILIVAVGKARMLKKEMVKEGAVVIDVGVNRDENGKLCGDVDFDEVEPIASVITKVPGGVGPMTITCLMENTIEAFKIKFI
jgi:methylenetetrahydrofolate dehydrogenase (NADP+)/methenyltetrahydrofolate cyclohydrolase